MRRRLLLVLLPLLTALLAALEVPLVQTHAAQRTQELFIEHSIEAQRYAASADRVLRTGQGRETLVKDLQTYSDTRPARVTVFDNDGGVELPERTREPSPEMRAVADAVLAGEVPDRSPAVWPWTRDPILVAAVIGSTDLPVGVVVLEASTAAVADEVGERIAILAAGGLAVLLLTTAICALPLAGWVLRPVHDLGATADRLAAGDLDARASERGGPPELRGLARTFNHMADTLVAVLQRQRAFVADASHELRNPLATIRLRMEALQGKVDRSGERDLRLALSESDRLANTIQRLLELARAEASAAEHVDFDVVALTAARAATWAPALEAAGSTLRIAAPEQALSRCSPDAVEYALDVVIDNARTFAPGAAVDVTIRQDDGWVQLCVRDHGEGLTPDELVRAGERFWRSASHRAVPGTGLGLATARALLESAGATLEVRRADPGILVALRLPAATGARDTSAPLRGAARAETSSLSPSQG